MSLMPVKISIAAEESHEMFVSKNVMLYFSGIYYVLFIHCLDDEDGDDNAIFSEIRSPLVTPSWLCLNMGGYQKRSLSWKQHWQEHVYVHREHTCILGRKLENIDEKWTNLFCITSLKGGKEGGKNKKISVCLCRKTSLLLWSSCRNPNGILVPNG